MRVGAGGKVPGSNAFVGASVGCPAIGCGGCLLLGIVGMFATAIDGVITALTPYKVEAIFATATIAALVVTILAIFFGTRSKEHNTNHKKPGGYQPQCGLCVNELRHAELRAENDRQMEQTRRELEARRQAEAAKWDDLHN